MIINSTINSLKIKPFNSYLFSLLSFNPSLIYYFIRYGKRQTILLDPKQYLESYLNYSSLNTMMNY